MHRRSIVVLLFSLLFIIPLLTLTLAGCNKMAEVKLNFMDIAYVREHAPGIDDHYGFSADDKKIAFSYILVREGETDSPKYEYVELWWPKVELPGYRRIRNNIERPRSWKSRCFFKRPSSFGNHGVLVSPSLYDFEGNENQPVRREGAEYDWHIFWIPAQDFRSAVKDTGALYVPPLKSLPKAPPELLKALQASSHEG